jgi:hypothetical protein
MIEAARLYATAAGASVTLTVGSMTSLPDDDGSFDVVLCLWSAFHELLEPEAQARAVGEMWRALSGGGFALVEGPPYSPPTPGEIAGGERRGPDHRVSWSLTDGRLNPHFLHDEASFTELCRAGGITSYEVLSRDWGGRPRLLLRFFRAVDGTTTR